MASNAPSPETPPESGECCLLKLPPELRVVIYNMVFEGLCFDGEEGWDDVHEKRLEAIDRGVKSVASEDDDDAEGEDDNSDSEDSSSDDEGNLEGEDDETRNEGKEVSSQQAEASDETSDLEEDHVLEDDNEMPEHDGEDLDMETDDGTSSDDLGAGSSDAKTDSRIDPNLHLTRPPLLSACRLIRREAIPIHINALFLLAIRVLKLAIKPMIRTKEKLTGLENGNIIIRILGKRLLKNVMDLMLFSSDRVNFVKKQIDSMKNSVEGSSALTPAIRDRILKVLKEYTDLENDIGDLGLQPRSPRLVEAFRSRRLSLITMGRWLLRLDTYERCGGEGRAGMQ